jgi:altronate hydrolase
MIKDSTIPWIKIHPEDNVLVALRDLSPGTSVQIENEEVTLPQAVAAKHKFFVNDMHQGDDVIMYGTLVGKVQENISKGELMTTANTKHAAGSYNYNGFHYKWNTPDISMFANRTFSGYYRSDGRVGTANYWLFIPTVF